MFLSVHLWLWSLKANSGCCAVPFCPRSLRVLWSAWPLLAILIEPPPLNFSLIITSKLKLIFNKTNKTQDKPIPRAKKMDKNIWCAPLGYRKQPPGLSPWFLHDEKGKTSTETKQELDNYNSLSSSDIHKIVNQPINKPL